MSENTALPCWYELGTPDLDAASTFYTGTLNWTVNSPGVPGFDYRIAADADGNGVAGMISTAQQPGGPSATWIFYLEVADCQAKAAQVAELGGQVLKPPADIPGTGVFAVCADPQGAVFGILQPLPMENPPTVRAFDQARTGHGNWHELSTSDPKAAFAFYSELFGWGAGEAMDMGEDGDYQIFTSGTDGLGGINPLMGAPHPFWLSYFGVEKVDATVEAVTSAGGSLLYGPSEVPGGAWIAQLTDDQGATFGIVGPSR